MSAWRLYLSLGNTSVRWAADRDAHWVAEGAAPPDPPLSLPGVAEQCARAGLAPGELSAVVACASTADLQPWREAVRKAWDRGLQVLGHDFPAPLRTRYGDPAELGPDRAANALGALAAGLVPALILDAGTCLTADVVDATGLHRGGAIAPGLPAMRAGILRVAPHLAPACPSLPLMSPNESPGLDTAENLAWGWLWALSGAARQMIAHLRGVTDPPARAILTGGDAQLLASLLPDTEATVWPRLTLEGLREAYRHVEEGER